VEGKIVLSDAEFQAEYMTVSSLVPDEGVSDAELAAAVERFKALPVAEPKMAQALLGLELTMECRSPQHLAHQRRG
jgi:hypothetical protein